jgi:hypothetical protein
MSAGSVLITVALALIVGAYIALPFRRAAIRDEAIDTWVAQIRAEKDGAAKERREGGET